MISFNSNAEQYDCLGWQLKSFRCQHCGQDEQQEGAVQLLERGGRCFSLQPQFADYLLLKATSEWLKEV